MALEEGLRMFLHCIFLFLGYLATILFARAWKVKMAEGKKNIALAFFLSFIATFAFVYFMMYKIELLAK